MELSKGAGSDLDRARGDSRSSLASRVAQAELNARTHVSDERADTGGRWFETMLSPASEASPAFITWAFRYLLVHLSFRYAIGLLRADTGTRYWVPCLALMATALVLSFRAPRRLGWAKASALLAASIEMVSQFPTNSNHSYLEYLLLLAFVVLDFEREEQRASMVALGRWLVVLIFFHSGLQKVLYGTYFDGMYLATMVDADWGAFRQFLELVLPSAEFEQLTAALRAGAEGPYRFQSPLALAISNGIYLSELLVAALMLSPRWRLYGAIASLGVIAAIESTAHELTFGLLALNLIALFFASAWRVRFAALSVLSYAGLAVAQAIVGDLWFFI